GDHRYLPSFPTRRSSDLENIGIVQEGMESIAVPLQMQDAPDAKDLEFRRGEIRFENVSFGYDPRLPVLNDISLTIRPGEKVGLRSEEHTSELSHVKISYA